MLAVLLALQLLLHQITATLMLEECIGKITEVPVGSFFITIQQDQVLQCYTLI